MSTAVCNRSRTKVGESKRSCIVVSGFAFDTARVEICHHFNGRPYVDDIIDLYRPIVHMRTMLETPAELTAALGQRIKARRLLMGYTQADAAARAGVAYRTWRRLESEGKASIEDLVRAAIGLRCERDVASLFPEPAATSMDALLQQQKAAQAAAPKRRLRAPSSKASS